MPLYNFTVRKVFLNLIDGSGGNELKEQELVATPKQSTASGCLFMVRSMSWPLSRMGARSQRFSLRDRLKSTRWRLSGHPNAVFSSATPWLM